MQGKTLKTIIIVLIIALAGVGTVFGLRVSKTLFSGASSGAEPQSIQIQTDAASATISWQTDKEAMSTIEYGTTAASLLLRAIESQSTKVHRVVLAPLKENTTYFFRVRVGEDVFDNGGMPYSLKTKAGSGSENTGGGVTPTSKPAASLTSCVQAEFKEKFGTSDSQYDLDKNGIVNSADWIKCLQKNK